MIKSLISLTIIAFFIPKFFLRRYHDIKWHGKDWALGCDFKGHDLSNVQIHGEDCGERCFKTPGCTHFTWKKDNGGTCYMKYGCVSKDDVVQTGDLTIVCGAPDGYSSNICSALSDIPATRHVADESSVCALPASNEVVVNSIALGNIESLKHLRFRPELFGQILNVSCGYGSLHVITTNSSSESGLNLYTSAWTEPKNGKSSGNTLCTVELTTRKAFNSDGPRCFYKPGTDFPNTHRHHVGLLNTKGRLIVNAMIDNQAGKRLGNNPYYLFDSGRIDGNKQILFTFDDGTTQSVYLQDCEYQKNEQMWS